MPQQLTLRQIQQQYNDLAGLANERGMTDVRPWTAIPCLRDRGMQRLNALRLRLGMTPLEGAPDVQASAGAILPLATIREQWNALVPAAQARGLNVQLWRGNPTTGRRGMDRLNWLRSQMGTDAAPIVHVDVPSTAAPTPTTRIGRARAQMVTLAPHSDIPDMTFGVELECIKPSALMSQDISMALRAAGVPCNVEAYNHQTRMSWKIVTDGSLGDYTNGLELVSPILRGAEGLEQVRKVCAVLVAHRVRVSKKCGFHVHVGARSESIQTLRNVAKLYIGYGDVIRKLLAPSRRQNSYCPVNMLSPAIDRVDGIPSLLQCIGQYGWGNTRGGDRYRALNFLTLHPNSYGTIEFRQHQGTIEADKATNWIVFCLRMVHAARTWNGEKPEGLDGLARMIGLTAAEHEFFKSRETYFARREAAANRRRAA